MLPTQEKRLSRIGDCITDLSENGIEVSSADDLGLNRVIRDHLEYFQLMLGYDSDPEEVLLLIKQQRRQNN